MGTYSCGDKHVQEHGVVETNNCGNNTVVGSKNCGNTQQRERTDVGKYSCRRKQLLDQNALETSG